MFVFRKSKSSRMVKPFSVGIAFSPAGLMTTFHLGVVQQLRTLRILHDQIPLSGSSGGALAAVTASVPIEMTERQEFDSFDSSVFVAKQCRDYGARGTLGKALGHVLQQSLPDNIAEILNNRPAPCTVAYTEVSTFGIKSRFVSRFQDRQDVIDCLRASCNIPLYLDGSFAVPVRGAKAVDGFFAVEFARFGCPFTGATDLEVLVTPFKARLTNLDPKKVHPKGSSLQYEIISPDLLDRKSWPFSSREIVQMGFTAPKSKMAPEQPISDNELIEIYQLVLNGGIEATNRWFEKSRLVGKEA